jgi:hypothetical protein
VTERFEGTFADLLQQVTPADTDWRPPKDWPVKPRQVTTWMRRLAPSLRKTGWTVEDLGSDNHAKLIRWSISPPAQPEKSGDDTRPPPQDPQNAGDAGIGVDDSRTSTSVGRKTQCARCGGVGGPGGVLCATCKDLLGTSGEKTRIDPRLPPQDPRCSGCGSDEDSYWHAVTCLGQGQSR